jgi:hypothetical protein
MEGLSFFIFRPPSWLPLCSAGAVKYYSDEYIYYIILKNSNSYNNSDSLFFVPSENLIKRGDRDWMIARPRFSVD